MSIRPFALSGGKLDCTISLVDSNSRFVDGLPYDAAGKLHITGDFPTTWNAGIPQDVLGAVCAEAAPPVTFVNGIGITATGKVAGDSVGGVVVHLAALPRTATGAISNVAIIPPTYSPSDNPASLFAWYRTGIGITQAAGLASAWADQSANGRNLTQATGSFQPNYSAGVLSFDGIDDVLRSAGVTLPQPYQVSMLVAQRAWTANDTIIDLNTTGSSGMYQNIASPNIAVNSGLPGNVASTQSALGAVSVITTLVGGASSSIKVGSNSENTGNAGANAGTIIALGGPGATVASYGNIQVLEVIIRNINDPVIRANDHAYLQSLALPAAQAATLSAAQSGTATATGATGAGVTTNQGTGTLYWAVVTNGGSCTDAQLKAGSGGNIVPGVAGNQAVTVGGGPQVIATITGLAATTTYQIKTLQRNVAALDSAQASSSLTTIVAPYLPSDNPASLVAWFRKGVGVTLATGVQQWADQSGNLRQLIQNTANAQPAYNSGTGEITFDGIDDFLQTGTFTLSQPTQISILFKQNVWTDFTTFTDGNGSLQALFYQNSVSPNIQMFTGAFGPASTNLPIGVMGVVTLLFNGFSSSMKVGSNADIIADGGTNSMNGLNLGARANSSLFSNIAVKEIIIRNVDDPTIRANDHAYLMALP